MGEAAAVRFADLAKCLEDRDAESPQDRDRHFDASLDKA
jgi:hypothetical protein